MQKSAVLAKNIVAKTGNEAAAEAMRQINPDVVAAFPITPQTEIMQIYSSFVADGLVDTEFVAVESEHSAMSATIGASAGGGRAMTATSSQGLALMWEMLYIAAALRLPIVMPVVNRTLSAPINIHCDHSDTMGARDSGWIQLFSENAQEVYDNVIQAVRIAEDKDVLLPVMVTLDGFIISHGLEAMELIDDDKVKAFVGERKAAYSLLDVDHPITLGALDFTDYYFEHKMQEIEAMDHVIPVILKVGKEFGEKFGREYKLFEEYKLEGAEVAIIVLGSAAGTAKAVVDELRGKGLNVGLLKLRVFRPFPYAEIADLLSKLKVVAVMDRSDGLASFGGPLFAEVRSALYDLEGRPLTVNYVYGLGGRDVHMRDIQKVYEDLGKIVITGKVERLVNYLGVRE